MSLNDLVEAYALDPTAEGLHDLQAGIMAAPRYDPLLSVSRAVVPLLRDGKHQEIVDLIRSWMPGALLSPSAHGYLAKALTELGDAEAGRIEAKFSRLALDSIAASGSGSEEEPCSVLRIEDEYDILRASSQRPTAQRQVSDERGQFDVHTLEDGGEVWFRLLWLAPSAAGQEDEAGGASQS
ncbi:DUF4919 domain-containing protein [Brachybacterium paraconglomeratum]|uniref:DUF4919 domain-containing protein n=1 Tax=Brachybacterium paraconglomeratum TaxID=173362 RepID=UPI0022B0479D|nr:DUF4919 domain-containing protein [Brachybacterium paraconglomeratum]MCZ4325069.1 DUF4919 domain-containing protein [Brachybacterium paraconglomeratum]